MPRVEESVSLHPAAINLRSRRILLPVIGIIALFLLVCLIFNSPLLFIQIRYALSHPAASSSQTMTQTPASGAVASSTSQGTAVSATPQILIPAIGVQAPIVFVSTLNNTAIMNGLENGVVHYASTALPGQIGNVAIFGHSSEDWWEPGDYKFIFTLLDKLQVGDRITIDYNGQALQYSVTGSKVVRPSDVAVLDPTPTPTLSLITCTPIGTSLNRLIVTAAQITPTAEVATVAPAPVVTPSAAASETQTLPAGNSGVTVDFWNMITLGWNEIFH